MTTLISITLIVILVIALALVVPTIRRKNREANVARAEQLRSEAAASAQTVLPPAQARAAETEANAEEARAIAERAEAEAQQARLMASQAEAAHEDQIRAADRLDPRIDHKADDYVPQVPGTVDQGPTPPAEVNAEPEPTTPEPAAETTAETTAPAEPVQRAEEPRTDEAPADEAPADETRTDDSRTETQAPSTPLLPRRTPGANEMPGKPLESEGGGGGWFTRKDSTDS
ncbi:hypothetical protein ASC64_01310 [Nocardioides sp. Root122]|uniref:hypothetical protein n=1 Tax=Nocardioides TaxID=1839 RepID=UPI00070292A9|nr:MULTISPECIES: hypothetical protein [Nocardioides]KQV77513.1 hypothetical protein ASC64_01310 [Nocardioides sp. Root122]MCK9821941.1 hypothetical protein [Nocardioides cavernae]